MEYTKVDEPCSSFQVGGIYVEAISCCCEHFWHNYSIHVGNNRIFLNFCSAIQMAVNLQITADGPLIFLAVHAAEHFLHVFVCSLFVDGIGNGWKVVRFLCATTLLLGCAWKSLWIIAIFWIVPDVHCCHQTLHIFTGTEFTLHYEVLLKIFSEEWIAVTFTVSSRRFHCWKLEGNSSALLFDHSRSRTSSFFVMLRGSVDVMFQKNSEPLEVGCMYFWVYSPLPHHSLGINSQGILE